MDTEQWPLTAAATQILIDTPPAAAKRGADPRPKETARLALKELIFRGAFTVEITKRRGRPMKLNPQTTVVVPKSLDVFYRRLKRWGANDIKDVMRAAGHQNQNLLVDVDNTVRRELKKRKLLDEREERRLGLLKARRWVRTTTGDTWAADARDHLDRIKALAVADGDGASVAVAAGAAVILVPEAMGPLADLGRRRAREGAGTIVSGPLDSHGSQAFDPFAAVPDLVESGLGAIESAVDSGVAVSTRSVSGDGGDGGGF